MSCYLYIKTDDSPTVPILLSYRVDTMQRRNCPANDETGCTQISLWDDHIKQVSLSGSYNVTNTIVKSYNNITFLTNFKTKKMLQKQKSIHWYHQYQIVPWKWRFHLQKSDASTESIGAVAAKSSRRMTAQIPIFFVPESDVNIQLAFLQDESTVIFYDSHFYCLGFERWIYND